MPLVVDERNYSFPSDLVRDAGYSALFFRLFTGAQRRDDVLGTPVCGHLPVWLPLCGGVSRVRHWQRNCVLLFRHRYCIRCPPAVGALRLQPGLSMVGIHCWLYLAAGRGPVARAQDFRTRA